jgi:hypothetical protein
VQLVIKRSDWLRGEEGVMSYLLRPGDHKKCCLGFLAEACGYSADELYGQREPFDLVAHPPRLKPFPEAMKFLIEDSQNPAGTPGNSAIARHLMKCNDDPALSAWYREKRIASYFAAHGIEVEFVD